MNATTAPEIVRAIQNANSQCSLPELSMFSKLSSTVERTHAKQLSMYISSAAMTRTLLLK